jgi:hypothetical protein
MADAEIPNRFLPALRLFIWAALPFIFFLIAVERLFEGHKYQALASFGAAALSFMLAVYWDRLVGWAWPYYNRQPSLSYLSDRDFPLDSAIQRMARRSAWGRWFAAQHLVSSGSPIGEGYLLQMAGSIVMDKILSGDLEVRGRRPGRMDYEAIPRTDWRSSGFHFVNDPISLWRMVIFPRGGAEIAPNGTIARASNAEAAARNSQLANYDSLLIDAHQFEKLWPQRDVLADRKRRKFLRQARKRGLDNNEIRRLS